MTAILVQPLTQGPILVTPYLPGAPTVIALESIPGPPGASLSAIELTVDAGVTAIGPGVKTDVTVEHDHVITGWRMVADRVGDLDMDISMTSFDNFPAGFASIDGGNLSMTGAEKAEGGTLGWMTTIPARSILRYTVLSASLIRRVTVALKVERG